MLCHFLAFMLTTIHRGFKQFFLKCIHLEYFYPDLNVDQQIVSYRQNDVSHRVQVTVLVPVGRLGLQCEEAFISRKHRHQPKKNKNKKLDRHDDKSSQSHKSVIKFKFFTPLCFQHKSLSVALFHDMFYASVFPCSYSDCCCYTKELEETKRRDLCRRGTPKGR